MEGDGPSTAAETSTTTTSGGTTSRTTTNVATTAMDPGDDATSMSFIHRNDLGPDPGSDCDIYAQDCPAGQKCAWTAKNWDYPEYTHCVPLAEEPLPNGAPCSYDVDHPYTGIDNCGPAAVCLDDGYGQDGQGVCKSLCLGSWEHPYCPSGSICVGGRALWVCEATCDPIAQNCPEGARCDLWASAPLCAAVWEDGPNLGAGAECDYAQECALGLTCWAGAVQGCVYGCCTPFCDRNDAKFMCPLPGQSCQQPYDDFLEPGTEALGVCRQEMP